MNKENYGKLKGLKLPGMAEEYNRQCNLNDVDSYTFEQRLTLLIDAECDSQINNKITRLMKSANLSEPNASIHQIKYYEDRHLDRSLINELATNQYINKNRNIILTGATGTGKSYIANSFGVEACQSGKKVIYIRLPDLLNELGISRLENKYQKILRKYHKCELLIIDEWLLVPTNEIEQRDLLEIFERRYRSGSTILCTQYSIESWHKKLGGGAIADAVMDRIIPNSAEIFIDGKTSMRTKIQE